MPTPTFTRDILLAALAGFQLDKQRIDTQIAEVQAMLDGSGTPARKATVSVETPGKTRGKRSAAVRRRLAEAQKARWAKIKGVATLESVSPSPATPEAAKAKRQISEEGMKRIIAATKKRWKLQKAAAKAEKAAPKKAAAKKAAKAKAVAKKVSPVKKAVKKSAARKTPPATAAVEAAV
jgi:hypothetical protein